MAGVPRILGGRRVHVAGERKGALARMGVANLFGIRSEPVHELAKQGGEIARSVRLEDDLLAEVRDAMNRGLPLTPKGS